MQKPLRTSDETIEKIRRQITNNPDLNAEANNFARHYMDILEGEPSPEDNPLYWELYCAKTREILDRVAAEL